MLILEYPKVICYTKFEHFEIIRCAAGKQTDGRTDKQTDPNNTSDRQSRRGQWQNVKNTKQ